MLSKRDEAFAKIGTRVQLHDYEEENFRTSFKEGIPAGTTGRVIHANLLCRFTHPEYKPTDVYEYVIEWDSLARRIDLFDASDYEPMVLVSDKLLNNYRTIKLMVHIFRLAVVRRLLHAGRDDILPLRGEPYDHGRFDHGIVRRGR